MLLKWLNDQRTNIALGVVLLLVAGYAAHSACAQQAANGRHHREAARNEAAQAGQQAGGVTDGPQIGDDVILATIKKQVDFLLSQKQNDNWEPREPFIGGRFDAHGGQTSMVLYALLYAGRCIDDPRLNARSPELKPAVLWVNNLNPIYTYAAALQAIALAQIPDVMQGPYKTGLSRAAQLLVDNVSAEGTYSYMWTPPETHHPLHWSGRAEMKGDNSNGQYGLLGVWVAQDAGFEVPVKYWDPVNGHWTKSQNADGGWGYSEGKQKDSYLNMTTAGLASLYITTECTDMAPPQLVGTPEPGIDRGLEWMKNNFEARRDAYGLYGCERVGLASGLKYFGTHNWYQEGAAAIIAAEEADGSCKLHVEWTHDNIPSTAYALLFLCRGRNPVLFNKLEYHDPLDPKPIIWNARPRDLANLTHQFSKKFEEDFNWHVVNLQVPAEDWLDSPVLLITGSRDPHFTDADIAKLKTFVDDGGTIFSSSDGPTEAFDNAMKKYAQLICDKQYEMRELPKDHPLYSIQYRIDSAHLMGLSNGIRELWIHSPGDLGAIWQRRAYAQQVDWQIPANLYLYATGKVNSREKFQNLRVPPANGATTRNIAVARVEYAGNWDPEPGAWPRMAKLAAASFHTALAVSDVAVGNLNAKATPIAHLTGTAGFSLSPDNVDALRKYLDSGGTLLVDAGGRSETFMNSFNKLTADLYPKDDLVDVPADSPLITGQGITDGGDISDIEYRKSTLKKHGKPPLVGLMHNGRFVIIVSPFDFTSGLLGTNTWGIEGYTPDSAQAIVRNLLLFAAAPPAAAKQGPATQSAPTKTAATR